MQVIVSCEFRFYQTPDGQVWTPNAFHYGFWDRYLQVFSQVKILARVLAVEQAQSDWQKVTGERVSLLPMPYYLGLAGLIRSLPAMFKQLRRHLSEPGAVIFRVPSQTAMLARLARPSRAYALEVVGDPADVFAAGITHPLIGALLGPFSAWQLRKMVKSAKAVSYVTRDYLQKRYPAAPAAKQVACSSIELDKSWLAASPRQYNAPAKRLLFIGSFSQLYKGQDTLIEAMAKLKEQGLSLHLTMIGGGKLADEMKALTARLNLQHEIHFAGEMAHGDILKHLNDAELFIMPSRTEGLPRALLEAMATGLPAIGTKVGGIPELLNEPYLVNAEDAEALSAAIARLSQDPQALCQASAHNIATAKDYERERLAAIRRAFYQFIERVNE
ncbi:glycosyltransferase [Aliiglaciecola sp. CAU 1673]|uniref:glycosyltransferase n=1 Tax=Aliiglaciecola sp. CAU 1673 TaxID=3032595 RepID=UPI0023DB801A|nr:glycosyltransferase [Aliiglaciecola sp. CAU 1673]MDF2179790.1 glycosyltransferase [Aliiglaciecola sp. CAU 1673]